MEKIIKLIQKTGDKCIILDSQGNPAYVAMSFADYEKLILSNPGVKGLTEDELLEKINRDIALWRASQQGDKLADWQPAESASQQIKRLKKESEIPENSLNEAEIEESEDKYYFEPIE